MFIIGWDKPHETKNVARRKIIACVSECNKNFLTVPKHRKSNIIFQNLLLFQFETQMHSFILGKFRSLKRSFSSLYVIKLDFA